MFENKKKGHKPAKVAEPDDTTVVDLMSALRASLSAKGQIRHQTGFQGKAGPGGREGQRA
jgi:DNA end-binding protein Ku